MLKYKLTNPDIISVLSAAGHGAKVLIADSNYPVSTKISEKTQRIYLNVAPGIPSATEILEVLLDAIEIESAHVMQPDDGGEPVIFKEFSKILPNKIQIEKLGRHEFYDVVCGPDACLVIQTGEQRVYANLLLTIGAIVPNENEEENNRCK